MSPGPASFWGAVYWVMISTRVSLLTVLLPATAIAQVTQPKVAGPPPYRGFVPGIDYRSFVARARSLADRDTLRCNTSRNTAQLIECGVAIRDPGDAARFYLSAHFVEGRADVVAFKDSAGFGRGDAPGTTLVTRTKRELTRIFGRPRPNGRSGWEWRYGRKAIRLSWRGRGTARWVAISLNDYDVMDRIGRYVKAAGSRKP